MRIRIYIIVMALCMTLFTGCSDVRDFGHGDKERYNVLCLFVYDSIFSNYRIYENTFATSLKKNGISADIRNVYSSGHLDVAQSEALEASFTRLNNEGWVPDVVR